MNILEITLRIKTILERVKQKFYLIPDKSLDRINLFKFILSPIYGYKPLVKTRDGSWEIGLCRQLRDVASLFKWEYITPLRYTV